MPLAVLKEYVHTRVKPPAIVPETTVSVAIVSVDFGIPKSRNVIPAGVIIEPNNDVLIAWFVVVAFAQFEAAP